MALSSVMGCGGGSSATIGDLYDSIADAFCQWEGRCGLTGKSEVPRCTAEARAYFHKYFIDDPNSTLNEALAAGRIKYDANAGANCLAFYQTLTCNYVYNAALAACQDLFRGQVPNGGMCKNSIECSDGTCTGLTGCANNTCTTFLAQGATCDSGQGSCNPRTDFCETMAKVCTARGALGATCSQSSDCQSPYSCLTGKCGGPGNLGDPCNFTSGCGPGLYCDIGATIPTCKMQIGSGGVCPAGRTCQDGLQCVVPKGMTMGTCGPLTDVGTACDSSAPGGYCPTDAPCSAMTMKCEPVPSLEGTDCIMDPTCVPKGGFVLFRTPLYCDAATKKCTAKVNPGSACTPPPMGSQSYHQPCLSSQCDAMTLTCPAQCF